MARIQYNKEQSSSFFLSFWRSKVFVLSVFILFLLFSVSLGKEISRRVEVNREIESLQEQITGLESKNSELDTLIAYLNTDTVLEKEARLKLGLQKPGESVFVIPGLLEETTTPSALQEQEQQELTERLSNPDKWWYYFFGS